MNLTLSIKQLQKEHEEREARIKNEQDNANYAATLAELKLELIE